MGAPLLLRQSASTGDDSGDDDGTGRGDEGAGSGAALLNSNAGHSYIAAQLGARRVRYGAVPVGDGESGSADIDNGGVHGQCPGDDVAHAELLQRQQQQPQPPLGNACGGVSRGTNGGAGDRWRLRLVDVDHAQRRGVPIVTPQTGDTVS